MSEDLHARFVKAGQDVTGLSSRPGPADLLKLYSLYKQATEGDCQGKRPGITNPVGRAKHDAWQALEGASKEDAMRQYAEHAEFLIAADKEQA